MFKHYIFTRFNLLFNDKDIYNNPDIEDPDYWMRHRCALFEDYCLPAMQLQTSQNFTWLLAFSEKTPDKYINKYKDAYKNIEIIYQYPRTYIEGLYEAGELVAGDWLITSRLDNDDFYDETFIEKVQARFNFSFKIVDTMGRQLLLRTGVYYDPDRPNPNSPFISLMEQVGTPWESIYVPEEYHDRPVRTVYYCSHTNMGRHFPAERIEERLYTMVIHDMNAVNRITGPEL